MTSDTWLLKCTYFAVTSLRAEEAVDLSASISNKNNQHELSHHAGSTASPNAPTPILLACGHLILHGHSHASASLWGGVMPMNKRGYYYFDGRSEGGWWSRSRRMMGGNASTSRGGREQEAAERREAKMKVKTEVQTGTMTARLLVATTTSTTQTNNQPTTGAGECRGLFGEARAEGRRQSHQRLRCLRSRDQQCNKSCRHQASADDRQWNHVPWCNRRRRCTIDGGTGGQGWEDEDDETL